MLLKCALFPTVLINIFLFAHLLFAFLFCSHDFLTIVPMKEVIKIYYSSYNKISLKWNGIS